MKPCPGGGAFNFDFENSQIPTSFCPGGAGVTNIDRCIMDLLPGYYSMFSA